jgi:hypothetical protein
MQSLAVTEVEWTRMHTLFLPGRGSGRSTIRITSGGP